MLFLFLRPAVEAETASSQRSSWRTTTQPSRMPSMRAGMWPSPGKAGPSRPPRRDRTKGRCISSRDYIRVPHHSPTQTDSNTLSSSVSPQHDELRGTGNLIKLSDLETKWTLFFFFKEEMLFYFYIFSYIKWIKNKKNVVNACRCL